MVFILIFSYLAKTGRLKKFKALPAKIRMRIIGPGAVAIFGFCIPLLAIE